eukprot:scaffold15048_cov69-Phaeocystis_antarctica.AAC.1
MDSYVKHKAQTDYFLITPLPLASKPGGRESYYAIQNGTCTWFSARCLAAPKSYKESRAKSSTPIHLLYHVLPTRSACSAPIPGEADIEKQVQELSSRGSRSSEA